MFWQVTEILRIDCELLAGGTNLYLLVTQEPSIFQLIRHKALVTRQRKMVPVIWVPGRRSNVSTSVKPIVIMWRYSTQPHHCGATSESQATATLNSKCAAAQHITTALPRSLGRRCCTGPCIQRFSSLRNACVCSQSAMSGSRVFGHNAFPLSDSKFCARYHCIQRPST